MLRPSAESSASTAARDRAAVAALDAVRAGHLASEVSSSAISAAASTGGTVTSPTRR